jgi:hypothetical protein
VIEDIVERITRPYFLRWRAFTRKVTGTGCASSSDR